DEVVAAGLAGDAGGREVGGLDDDLGGAVGDLRLQAAHGAGHGDRPRPVGDEDVDGVEVAHDVVERLQPLALQRPPHHDLAGELVGVEGVQRLAELQHEVVGDVDGQRHRTHAGPDEPGAHPQRRLGLRVEPGDLAQHEPVAGGRVVDVGGPGPAGV